MGETICAPTGNDPLNPWCGCGQKIGEPVTSICLSCLRPAHAYKIRSEDTPPRIYLVRECYNPGCMQNGEPLITSSRISSDAEFFWVLDKNNSCCGNGTCEMPLGGNVKGGNMSDLHGCTYVVDIIEECNLSCPTCYADAPHTSSGHTKQMSLKVFQKMILERIEKQGKIDIVQLSGGEPTLHPQLFEFVSWLGSLEAVADTLLNTNGVKLADPGFVQALAQHAQKGKFSVYLQYDGVMPEGQVTLRGGDYRSIRERALKNLEEYEIPVCLTMAVTHENLEFCWNTLDRALHNDNIRWVTFQPEFLSGRNDPQKLAEQPVSVAHIVHALNEKAQGVVNLQSFMPLPCSHPNCGTVGFVVRVEGKWHSVTTFVDLKNLTPFLENRMNFDIVDDVTKCGCDNYDLQKIMVQAGIHPNDIKMIFVKPFMDARTWDSERIKSCCTHVLYQNTQGETVVDSFCLHYANKGKIPLLKKRYFYYNRNHMIEIIPAILPQAFDEIEKQVSEIHTVAATVQIDFADGIYVPHKTWWYSGKSGGEEKGGALDKLLHEDIGLPMWQSLNYDFDLMIADPFRHIDRFIALGPSRIIIHAGSISIEDGKKYFEGLSEITKQIMHFGIALRTSDDPEKIKDLVPYVNLIQIMGVQNIGLQNQEFDEAVYSYVTKVRALYPDTLLAVDGGIKKDNAEKLAHIGITRFVIGSAIFKTPSPAATLEEFKDLCENAATAEESWK